MPEESQPKKVLVAQEEVTDRDFVRSFLETIGGFEVLEAANGVDLIQKLKDRPDLILVDTQIRGDVIRALELMTRMPRLEHSAIAMLSYEQSKMRQCLEKGADGFIIKPFSPIGFIAKVWKVLGMDRPEVSAGPGFNRTYKKQLSKIENLPTLPTVYSEVDRLCRNPDVAAEELSRVIEADAPITLKLLKLANSAFFSFSRKISSVKDAISLLGNKTVRNTILNISIFEATKGLKSTSGLARVQLWIHSIGCGSVARFLCKKLGMKREDSFTAGIVHDMGKIILDALYPDYYAEVIKVVAEGKRSIREAEEQVLSIDHTSIGLELATHWNLPGELLEAVAHHHAPSKAQTDPQIASLIHVSDAMSRRLKVGSGGDPGVPEPDPRALERLELTPERLTEWEGEIREAVMRDKAIMAILS